MNVYRHTDGSTLVTESEIENLSLLAVVEDVPERNEDEAYHYDGEKLIVLCAEEADLVRAKREAKDRMADKGLEVLREQFGANSIEEALIAAVGEVDDKRRGDGSVSRLDAFQDVRSLWNDALAEIEAASSRDELEAIEWGS